MQFFQDAKLKLAVLLRERKERAEAKKATSAAMASEHGHGRFFLLHVPAMATICAAVVEWYWAILFCIEATGGIDWNYQTATGSAVAAASTWNFAFETHWPIFLGLVCATIPIVMLSMVWLPVQFAMRGTGMWRRGTVIAVGVLANILVIVSGTVVMNGNRQEQVRADLVVEQAAEAERVMLAASVDDLRAELDTLMNHRSTYVATAASVGADAYERDYVAQARATRDPRLPLIERALGSARRADELRAGIVEARRIVAVAAPVAASQANVEDDVGQGLNTFAQIVEVWRPPFVAVICCLIGIFGAWWVLALMQGLNPRDVLRSGWADEGHRIEDLREEAAITPEPMKPAKRRYTDATTGDEIEEVLIKPRPYTRERVIKKGEKFQVDIQPDIPPDETGVEYDGGGRTGSVDLSGAQDEANGETDRAADLAHGDDVGILEAPLQADSDHKHGASENHEADSDQEEQAHPELPEEPLPDMSDEDKMLLLESAAGEPDAEPEQSASNDDGAEVEQSAEHHERTEPETDERKLIANVAAE